MLSWLGNDAFILEDAAFQVTIPWPATSGSIPERFSERTFEVMKPRSMLEQYVELVADLQPRNILEIGILRGGSTVFLTALAKPDKLVAIDLEDRSSPAFRNWLRSDPQRDHVVVHFGVDQSDATTLRSITADDFDGEPLDLIIDDASHLLAPTRASFEALFPSLRPGGVYVIEDWEAQHIKEKVFQDEFDSNPVVRARIEEQLREPPETWLRLREPVTKLIVQAVLASAYTDIIDDIRIRHGTVMIQRGQEEFDQDDFVISDFYLDLGRELLQVEPAAPGMIGGWTSSEGAAKTVTDPESA